MQDVENSILVKYGPVVLSLIIGIIQYSLRSLLKNIKDDIAESKRDIEALYSRDEETNHKLDNLIGEHNVLCRKRR